MAEGEAEAVIHRAIELGITLFETSASYRDGAMESLLGRVVPSDRTVVTRIGVAGMGNERCRNFHHDAVRSSFLRSRDRVQRECLDVVLLHNPTAAQILGGRATEVLAELKATGQIRAWGVSVGTEDAAKAAIEAGADVISAPYNVFFSKIVNSIAGDAAVHGTSILAHSVLAYGLLTDAWGANRVFDDGDHRQTRWSKELLKRRFEQVQVLRDLVDGEVRSVRSVALRYVLSNRLVSCALLGPRTTAQLDQLVRDAGSGAPYLSRAILTDLPTRLMAVGL